MTLINEINIDVLEASTSTINIVKTVTSRVIQQTQQDILASDLIFQFLVSNYSNKLDSLVRRLSGQMSAAADLMAAVHVIIQRTNIVGGNLSADHLSVLSSLRVNALLYNVV